MLGKKLLRTIWKYKTQFLSMIIMIAIGVGIFVGFHVEWYSLQEDTTAFFEDTAYADYRIFSEEGFSKEDVEIICNTEGILEADRFFTMNVGIKDTKKALALNVVENHKVSKMMLMEGANYDKQIDGIWLSDKFATENDIKIGDSITLTYRDLELESEVVGFIKSGEYLVCVADDNQLMPDYEMFGYAYISPEVFFDKLGVEYYPQINILSDLEKTDMENLIKEVLGKTTLVLSKEEHLAYASAQSETEEGKTMGTILPILFLLIAILTMVTTMHRITINEKTQIGTLKALGFQDKRIIRHYTSYGFFIGVVGSLLGVLLGYGIASIIVSPSGMMSTYFDMPDWKLHMPWFCYVVIVFMILLLTLIGFLSVKQMLKGNAIDSLKPYVPKKMKQTFWEKTSFWNRLSFGTKWNCRDILRHKARTSMTLLGIVGCMLLLVGGLGMKDTMAGFMKLLNEDVNNYETKINLVETISNEDAIALAKEVDGDFSSSSSVSLNGEAVTLEIYNVTKDKIRFLKENSGYEEISDEGAYICIRLAEDIQVGDRIEFSPYGSDETYSVKVAGVLRSVMTENIVMTDTYAQKIGIPYTIDCIYTDKKIEEIENSPYIEGKQSKQNIIDSYDSFMDIMNTMVMVLVLAAVILGMIVLYNLGKMSYVERYRELATLKVVGFKDKHIGKLLIGQNVWLTVIGVILGLPMGIGVLKILLITLGDEYELKLTVGILTISVSILVTFGVSVIVGWLIARKNRHIDMVEALKGID